MNKVANLAQGLELAEQHLSNEVTDIIVCQSFADKVVDFNQRVLKIDQRSIGMLNDAEMEISIKCLREEIDEFITAQGAGDLIAMVDSLIDLKYFATGVMYKLGLTAESIDKAEAAVHEANMEKKLGVVARRGDGSAADAIKPEGWVAPEQRIAAILDDQATNLEIIDLNCIDDLEIIDLNCIDED